MIRVALDKLYLWSGYAAGFFLVAIFAIMMIMSVGREFELNIPAGDDFASWCMAAMAFLGLAHTFKRGEMIRVGLLVEKVTGKKRWFLEMIALGIATVFVVYFAWFAVQMSYDSFRFHDMSTGVVSVPLWFPQLGYAAGLVILAIALIDEMVHVVRGNKPSYEKEPPTSPDEFVERVASGGAG